MRLLQCNNQGGFNITKDLDGSHAIPSYAVLSHTWGTDTDEVTFEDLTNGTGSEKPGYAKIRFCGEQAKQDGLQYFWVDTACIDKTNKAELSHAINSMFRWYHNATRCYVYMSDVSSSTREPSKEEASTPKWEPQFRQSRWFTRGWTLQELLAPDLVEFFSQEGTRLGNKASLEQHIRASTSIPVAALRGSPLTQFSVNERLSWIQHRHTKHEEDKAYSLLGIFGVYISPVYGEGTSGAFKRLMDEIDRLSRCIQDLRLTDPRDDKKRIEDTKGGLLKDSYRWILSNADFQQWRDGEQSRLLWIKGDPGKGKTMLLCGIIDELQSFKAKPDLLAFFFCQATDSRINNATAVLRGLLYMLVEQQPSLVAHIQKKHDHAGKALFEDANAWVALTDVFTNVLQDPNLSNTWLIVDGLDECIDGMSKLLEFVTQQAVSSRVKWVLSSRNWPDIEEQLEGVGHKVRLSLELNAQSVSTAVNVFIEQRVSRLAREKRYNDKIRADVQAHLAANSNDTFLWVALVCQNLEKVPQRNVMKKLSAFPPGLDSLYERMMQQLNSLDDADLCKQILASVAIVYRPITLDELAVLVRMPEDVADPETIREIVGLCGSYLTVRNDTVYFVHQSAKDFLFAKAFYQVFPCGSQAVHHSLFLTSLQILSKTLRRDMYSLKVLGCPIEQVEQPSPDPLAASRYSCAYWADHLCTSSASHAACLLDGGAVEMFLRTKFLYWLEALSLCKDMSKGLVSIAKLNKLAKETAGAVALGQLVQDAHRFIAFHKSAIENSPLQAYASALLFSPSGSLIRRLFKDEEPTWITIKPAMLDGWSACLQTLEGHESSVASVVFSHDSTWLASASRDSTIKIWDVSSGTCKQTLKGHDDEVATAVFSHDSTQLASVSIDAVKVWDLNSGACLQTKDPGDRAHSVAFSHDSTRLAAACTDTVRIWGLTSGTSNQTLKAYAYTVAFSHDSTRLVTAGGSQIYVWDLSSGACIQTLGTDGWTYMVALSHDSTQLAAPSDETVKIWDLSSGACKHTLEGHDNRVTSVAFSHDSTRLASASWDNTIKVWNPSSGGGACEQTLQGHSDDVYSVAFSHDSTRLASASRDNTIKIWDLGSGVHKQPIKGHIKSIRALAFSHDSIWLASASDDNTIKIWNLSSGACEQTLKGHSKEVSGVDFSYGSNQLASASSDGVIKIWDLSSGACELSLEGYKFSDTYVWLVRFSHDSSRVATASPDRNVKIWNLSSGACEHTLNHGEYVWTACFSHDSTQLASAGTHNNNTVKVWNLNSGKCELTLHAHTNWNGTKLSAVAFSCDSTRLASASSDGMVNVWDLGSGACVHTVDTGLCSGACVHTIDTGQDVGKIWFDITGLHLRTDIGTIALATLPVSSPSAISGSQHVRYLGGGVSTDGTWITYENKNVLWLPSEYRPCCSAVSGNTVGIAVGFGRVWICEFHPD
ncbi:beta transducin-like protein HET-E2C [Lophium mytilinum]|uniref:Mitochondrial division protein 1 n=1 Tax=Lophium mytilinum TaxID=390894 RepID=A0A6A6QD70_9PEZI|nr:beta transducin-like protein HET-E2C [Lophium mytilinum]